MPYLSIIYVRQALVGIDILPDFLKAEVTARRLAPNWEGGIAEPLRLVYYPANLGGELSQYAGYCV
jgi:hypothetical protein